MPRVKSFEIPGLELRFNSSDHMPPHFHAERPGEWEVRVYFLKERSEMIELKRVITKGPSASQLSQLTKQAEEVRFRLHKEWILKVSTSPPGKEK